MYLGLTSGLSSLSSSASVGTPAPALFAMLGSRNGFAIDFVARQMKINDAVTPANSFTGDPETKLTVHGADGYSYDAVRGLEINAARDFSVALATSLFPYDPTACTVLVRYRLNAAASTDQRYLFMADNGGNDRLTTYSIPGEGFRFATGDGSSADIVLSDLVHTPDGEYTAVFGIDATGKTFVDDNGVHGDNSAVLAASTPSHIGLGGYPDRVLRVLDGYISQILVICEPVPKAERLTLTLTAPSGGGAPASDPAAFDILGARDGFAIDFVAKQMKVNDQSAPANAFVGDPETKLTVFGADGYDYDPVRGLNISAARDFSIAFSTGAFPFNPSACTVYAKYRVNAATSPEQRYLFMTDNAGTDRFALYSVSGQPFRFVTGDGAAANVTVSSLDFTADLEETVVFGADGNGSSLIDSGGIHVDDPTILASSTPAHVGIGGYNDRVLRVLDGYLAEIVVVCEPVLRDARTTLAPFRTTYKAEGDSHTFNVSYGILVEDFYPARVIAALGSGFVGGNFGTSGDSSAEMVSQISAFLADGRPDIVSLYAGSNDTSTTVATSPAPTATGFDVANATKLAADGWIIVNGETAQIASVTGNSVTLTQPLSAAPPGGASVEIDTVANIRHWVQAMKAAGVQKILVIGSHYLNFSSSGDTPTQQQSLRAAMRIKQQQAATDENVPYVDTYAHMRDVILSGAVTQGDDLSWHVAAGNTHLNTAGEQALANAVHDAIVGLGWN